MFLLRVGPYADPHGGQGHHVTTNDEVEVWDRPHRQRQRGWSSGSARAMGTEKEREPKERSEEMTGDLGRGSAGRGLAGNGWEEATGFGGREGRWAIKC